MTPLGFSGFEAGISNQKIAFLGLAIAARAAGAPVRLPDIRAFPPSLLEPARSADAVFEPGALASAFETHGVELAGYGDLAGGDPRGYFESGAVTITESRRAGDTETFNRCADFMGLLRPVAALRHRVDSAVRQLTEMRVELACQLRVERDWTDYVGQAPQKFGGQEQAGLSISGILGKIRTSFPNVARIYATVDLAQLGMSGSELKAIGRESGMEIVTRPDISEDPGSQIDNSLLDFEIGVRLGAYVGNTRSTFFNLAALTSFGRQGEAVFYVYNNAAPTLRRRTDHGAFIRPVLATLLPEDHLPILR